MPEPTTTEPTLLQRMHSLREAAVDTWAKFVDEREKVEQAFEKRLASDTDSEKPSEDEIRAHGDARTAYRAEADQLNAAVVEWDARINDQVEIERRRAEAAIEHKGNVSTVHEPLTYRRDNARSISYYRDLAAAQVEGLTLRATTRGEALERLHAHAREMDVEMPARAAKRERNAKSMLEEAEQAELDSPFHRGAVYAPNLRWGRSSTPFERRIEPNRTDGEGGYFIPPLWLPDEFIPYLRAHLVAAGLCRRMDLPAGTDSINIPKLKTPTAVGYQQADTSGVVSQDWTDTFVTAQVKTIAGQSDVALQLLEQSPHMIIDEVITQDLMAAYNTFLDQQLLAGDGLNANQLSGGHLKGIYPAGNWTARTVTWTTGTPVGTNFVDVLGAMASQVARNRYDRMNYKVVLHGRRWFWYASSRDLNGRPLVEPGTMGPWNVAADLPDTLPAEGLAGTTNTGDPVYIDDNVPITGSTRDVAISALWDDVWLFEGEQRMNVFREVLSGSLGVRFQTYNYVADLVRYGQSLCIGSGSGFAAPTGKSTSVLF